MHPHHLSNVQMASTTYPVSLEDVPTHERIQCIEMFHQSMRNSNTKIEATSYQIERARIYTEFMNMVLRTLSTNEEMIDYMHFMVQTRTSLEHLCLNCLNEMQVNPTSDIQVNSNLIMSCASVLSVLRSYT